MEDRFDFTAEPSVFSVQHGSLVKTSFGSYLKRKGLMKYVTLALAAVAGIVTMLQPLHTDVPEDGPLFRQIDDGSARILELRVLRSGLFTWLTKEITCVMLWFLMLHHVNQEIFLASLWTFDFLMIMGSMVVAEFFRFYNMFDYWASLGYYDSTWIAFDFVDLFLVVLPTGLFISTMDSWHLAAWVNGARCNSIKITLSAIAVAYFTKSYLDTFFGHGSLRWAEREACVFGMCTNPRQAFASAELQKVLFMSKAMFKYAMGWPFASNVPRFTMKDGFPEPPFARLVNAASEALSSKATAMAGGRWSTATAPEVQPKEPAKDELPGHTGA